MLTANFRAAAIASCVFTTFSTQTRTSGGCREREAKDATVIPYAFPSCSVVTTVTQGTLQASDGAALGTGTINVGGNNAFTGVFDVDGTASVKVQLSGPARQASLTESFPGDANYPAASSTVPFAVQRDATSMSLTLTKAHGGVLATAVLTDSDTGQGVSGATVGFTVDGSAAGSPPATDANGSVSVLLKVRKGQTVTASFAGDGTDAGSSAQQTYG